MSIRGVKARSFQLLTEEQRNHFLLLCVLRGSWTPEDAEAITFDPMTPEHLAALADASLLQTDVDGDLIRFRMPKTLRQFAEEQFQQQVGADGMQILRTLHAAHFLQVAKELRRMQDGKEQASWMTDSQKSHDNCCAALEWYLKTPGELAVEEAIRIGTSLSRYWRLAGWQRRGSAYLRAVKNRSEFDRLSLEMRSALLNALGILMMGAGRIAASDKLFAECLQMRERIGDTAGVQATLNNTALLVMKRGDYEAAYRSFSQCLTYWQSGGDQARVSLTLLNMGSDRASTGDFAGALRHLEESRDLALSIGNMLVYSQALCSLGFIQMEMQEWQTARQSLEAALRQMSTLQIWPDAAITLLGLGRVSAAIGDLEQAQQQETIALDYCAAKRISVKDQLPFDNSPYWTEILQQTGPRKRQSLAKMGQHLRQAISQTLKQ